MRTSRTYYEILGLPRDATLVQIKRRYKQLVRKYHPDVARDKQTAHRLFIQITEAYEALTDPTRRRAYDATLDMERSRPSAQSSASTGSGGAHAQATPISKHLKDAQWAFIQRRFSEAANHCKEAIRIDERNAKAHAILGDIYRAQGKVDSAIKAYSYAVQYNPSDRETQTKLMNLVGRRFRAQTRQQPVPVDQVRLARMNMIWWGAAFFLIMLIGVYPGEPISWLAVNIPQVSRWSWNLIGLMAAASAVIGILLALNGLVKHPDDELVFESSGSNWAVVPAGLILLIGSGFFFAGAALFYIVVGLIQSSLSKSVMTTFACVVVVVLLSALVYDPSAWEQVLLFGGNISFLPMCIGWYIGSMLKPLNY